MKLSIHIGAESYFDEASDFRKMSILINDDAFTHQISSSLFNRIDNWYYPSYIFKMCCSVKYCQKHGLPVAQHLYSYFFKDRLKDFKNEAKVFAIDAGIDEKYIKCIDRMSLADTSSYF